MGALLLALTTSACGGGTEESPASAGGTSLKEVTYIIAAPTTTVAQAPYYLADELGYWKEEGLKVNFQNSDGTTTALQLMAAGKADLTCCGVSSNYSLFASGKDDDQRITAFHQKNLFKIYVPLGSDIREVKDLRGKTIGVQAIGSSGYLMARGIVAEAGLDPDKDVKWIAVGLAGQAAAALKGKQVDALQSYEGGIGVIELLSGGKVGGVVRAIHSSLDDLGATSAQSSTLTLAKDDPAAVEGFLRGLYKAYIFTATNPRAAAEVYWKKFPDQRPKPADGQTPEDAAADMVEAIRATWNVVLSPDDLTAFGELSPEAIQGTADFMAKYGVIKKPVDTAKLVDFSFVKEAKASVDIDAIVKQAKEWKP